MPLFHFHRIDGKTEIDPEGSELPNLDAAREEAIVYLGQSIKDHPGMLKDTGELRVEVTSENGLLLTTVIVHSIDAIAPEAIKKHSQI